ncbi:9117_t:CDS:1, partial [Funneliformis geosporum]
GGLASYSGGAGFSYSDDFGSDSAKASRRITPIYFIQLIQKEGLIKMNLRSNKIQILLTSTNQRNQKWKG